MHNTLTTRFTSRIGGFWGIDVDAYGCISTVADDFSVQKVGLDGKVCLSVGIGIGGFRDGPIDTAEFNFPSGLAVDQDGHVWVADTCNHAIRRISPQGRVVTVAGCGEAGFEDGQGDRARFNQPWDVAVNADGDALVADYLNNALRKVTPGGEVTTLVGPAPGNSSSSSSTGSPQMEPRRVAARSDGIVVVASDLRIWIVSEQGLLNQITLSDNWMRGRLAPIRGLTLDDNGNCVVANNCKVFWISCNGDVLFSQALPINDPYGIALDRRGNYYVSHCAGIDRIAIPILQLDMMRQLIGPCQFADVIFRVGEEGRCFHAHRSILSGRSEYFKKMFLSEFQESGQKDIILSHVRPLVFRSVMIYLYTGISDMVDDELIDVAAIADEYQLTELSSQCQAYCQSHLNVSNALSWLKQADERHLTCVKSTCFKFVFANVVSIVRERGDTLLNVDPLCRDLLSAVARERTSSSLEPQKVLHAAKRPRPR